MPWESFIFPSAGDEWKHFLGSKHTAECWRNWRQNTSLKASQADDIHVDRKLLFVTSNTRDGTPFYSSNMQKDNSIAHYRTDILYSSTLHCSSQRTVQYHKITGFKSYWHVQYYWTDSVLIQDSVIRGCAQRKDRKDDGKLVAKIHWKRFFKKSRNLFLLWNCFTSTKISPKSSKLKSVKLTSGRSYQLWHHLLHCCHRQSLASSQH